MPNRMFPPEFAAASAAAASPATIALSGATAGTVVHTVRVTGDAGFRFRGYANGDMEWGPGDATYDVGLVRDAANILAQRSGTNAQILRVYGTFTDASNYERLAIIGGTVAGRSAVLQQQAGTGTEQPLQVGTTGAAALELRTNADIKWTVESAGHFFAFADNTYDIGASGATRPRTVYIGTSIVNANGTVAAPSYTFTGQTNSGLCLLDPDPTLINQGSAQLQVGSGQIVLPAGELFGWTSGTITGASTALDLSVTRDAANILAQRSGTNIQILRVYGTFTDASNYERLALIGGTVAGRGAVLQQQAGTGTEQPLQVGTTGAAPLELRTNADIKWTVESAGHFFAFADNTYDIGASGATRPRTAYIGTSVIVPAVIGGTATGNTLTLRSTASGVGDILFFIGPSGPNEAGRFLSTGEFLVGTTAKFDGNTFVTLKRDGNGTRQAVVHNDTNGTSAVSGMKAAVSSGATQVFAQMLAVAPAFTADPTVAGFAILAAGGSGLTGFLLRTETADPIIFHTGNVESFRIDGTTQDLTFAEGVDLNFGTTTGSMLGTTASQKLGLWGATPVIQQAGIVDADGTLADVTTKFNTLIGELETIGVLAVA